MPRILTALFCVALLTTVLRGDDSPTPAPVTPPPVTFVEPAQVVVPMPTKAAKAALVAGAQPAASVLGSYVLIGWNDLGMHCINGRFAEMAILPPYNNLHAVVIKRGEEPQLMGSSVTVKYALDQAKGMTDSTDFWVYAPKLFGKTLPLGIGLTGNGLSGTMKPGNGEYVATGVPALPYNRIGRSLVWQPYQTAVMTATLNNVIIGQERVVVPVSDEMNCAKCHSANGVAGKGIKASTVEGYILTLHDLRSKTKLMASRPVLCASCHSDNALGTPGVKGVSSMSLAMHNKHSTIAVQPACYDCHPGNKTQCNRSMAQKMGPVGNDPKCADCHGNLTKMASVLKAGRKPWLQEPTCAQCHGAIYSTGTTLYRMARGHGGVQCITCHNSPHAWWPSRQAKDNLEPDDLQHNNHAIGYYACFVCHTDKRTGKMPPHQED